MTDKTSTPDNYRIPSTDYDGAVKFAPDPETGIEQVDFHLSNLERTAAELAISAHPADPTELDNSRLEQFSGDLAKVIPLGEPLQPEQLPHHTARAYSLGVASLRQGALNDAQSDTDSHKAA